MCLSAFHYQSDQFNDIKPPTFGTLDRTVTEDKIEGRQRESIRNDGNVVESTDQAAAADQAAATGAGNSRKFLKKPKHRRLYSATSASKLREKKPGKSITGSSHFEMSGALNTTIPIPQRFQDQFLNPDNGDPSCESSSANTKDMRTNLCASKQAHAFRHITKTRRARLPKPTLFLQETAHLISLLNAIALSTLRNGIDQAESPVTAYIPGQPWPVVDPDTLSQEMKKQYGDANPFWSWLEFSFGLSRSTKRRTLYNAARPFGVLGGVSDEEIRLLQRARGPYAKVSLVTMWLQEFVTRESMSGSTGNVAPPIVARLYQFISDGVVGYNQARKVAYVPYPFVGAQITAFFSLAIIFIFPLLFTSFVTELWLAVILNFLTVLCFLGLHEVARELECPFQNVPNDLPLTTFQAQLNEALVTMYAGFHPDGWWEVAPETELSDSEDQIFF